MPLSFGFLSTYQPTQCGLATFTASLREQLAAAGHRCGVVRIVDQPGPMPGGDVVHQLVRGSVASSMAAAEALADYDVVVIQHEFGIFSGADGEDVLDVLDGLRSRVIVVLHTVLTSPTQHQREVLQRVIDRADALVTMTVTAQTRLLSHYSVDPGKVVVIPHGAPEVPRAVTSSPRAGAPTMLTWGLLGPGKGIESVIDAMVELRKLDQPPSYRVVGQTHPRVFERDGEVYRDSLVARAASAGVGDLVSFVGSYLDASSLGRLVAQADVVVLPYESREQVTSGVLSEAVAAGVPVVATAFPHAVELLSSGAGLVVPHDDPPALALALRRVLTEPGLALSMASRSEQVAPGLRWSSVAGRYRQLADRLVEASMTTVA